MPRERLEIVGALSKKGFSLKEGKGDHDFYFFETGGLTQAIFTKVSRGPKFRTIDDSLVSLMSKQIKLTRRQFDQLIDCSLDLDVERSRCAG